ncbi:MAG: PH domain-containing protein [Candidatus Giovannonibacteria bacterium]|nr:MAG: PH domain-containing protein [Candidatus Giovannonibacteria bacterium]
MIHLSQNEKVLMVLHRHWIVIVLKFLIGVILLILPAAAAPFFPAAEAAGGISQVVLWFFALIYLLIIMAVMFFFWIDYYLDVWIITSERIVDINQKGLFNRDVSEFMLDKVQDITIEIPNMAASLLRYGNIIIQTAGERSFAIKQVPRIYEAKNLILDYAKKQNVGAL